MIHIITNAKGFTKSFEDFTRNSDSRYQGFDEEINAVPKIIFGRFEKTIFDDESLTNEESLKLKQSLENKIKELLFTRVFEPNIRTKIEFLGEFIGLNYTPFGKNSQDLRIDNLYRAYKICEECLNDSKPVYLSVTEGND